MADKLYVNGDINKLSVTPSGRKTKLGGIAAGTNASDATNLQQVQTLIAAAESGAIVTASVEVTGTTDSTSKDTGSIITEGGVGVEKAIVAGTSITATTQLPVSATSNQLRLGNIAANDVIISSTAPAADSVYTIPDAGTAANFVMSESDQAVNGVKTFGSPIRYSSTAVVVAFAGGGQASATALTAEFNNITTVATAGDSVKLPTATVGAKITVKNSGATAVDIFPFASDAIDALAVNLAVRIQPGSTAVFSAITSALWESSIDASLTLVAPTTNTGSLSLLAADSAGNFATVITNASQAAARTYTIPDAGASASFLMSEGAQTVNGVKTFGDATDSTSKDTGGVITEGGVGIEKALFVGTTVNAGTALTVGTDETFAKEVNHTVKVADTTTAATVGGAITYKAGKGNTSGAGGAYTAGSGDGGATGASGLTTLTSGDGGATSGASADTEILTGNATVGGTGDVILRSGDTASGLGGDVIIETGASTSATVVPVCQMNARLVVKPSRSTVASGGSITAIQLVGGSIDATGATGAWQLPTAAEITTAIGSTPPGTYFEFIFNAAAMTATNVATLVVGANMVVPTVAITGSGDLTVGQDTHVVAKFGIIYDTATTCKLWRLC